METVAENCFEQECSQGLSEIVDKKKPLHRTTAMKNYNNSLPLTYRGSLDPTLLLARDFFVEIYDGEARIGAGDYYECHVFLKTDLVQKMKRGKILSSSSSSNNRHINSNRY